MRKSDILRGIMKASVHENAPAPRPMSGGPQTVVLAVVIAASLAAAQPATPASGEYTSFEVASVKPGNASERITCELSGHRFRYTNVTLDDLIFYAYHINSWQLEGGPSWVGDDRYSIEAMKPVGSKTGLTLSSDDELRVMLQSLLGERFGLRMATKLRQGQVYALVVQKNGPKLKVSSPNVDPNGMVGALFVRTSKGRNLVGIHASMADLASALSGKLQRPVIDETSLGGWYDFSAEFSDAADVTDEPSLFTALQDNLGLALQTRTGQIATMVIEHVERPRPN
jgi:uncharacterized protein (TIGR03435 family)